MSEASNVFKLKKSDIQAVEVSMPLYIYKCPLCKKTMTSVYRDKVVAAIKLHVERTHGLKVEVVDG